MCKLSAFYFGVALFLASSGHFLSTTILYPASRHVSISLLFFLGLLSELLGNLMYALSGSVWMLMIAFFVISFGKGTDPIGKVYFSQSLDTEMQKTMERRVNATQILGYVIGPRESLWFLQRDLFLFPRFSFLFVCGASLVVVAALSSFVEVPIIWKIDLNTFTLPAWISALLTLGEIVVLLLFFRYFPLLFLLSLRFIVCLLSFMLASDQTLVGCGCNRGLPKMQQDHNAELTVFETNEENDLYSSEEPSSDKVGIFSMISLVFITSLVYSMYNTITTPATQFYFHWGTHASPLESDTCVSLVMDNVKNGTFYNGLLMTFCSVTFAGFLFLSNQFNRISISHVYSNQRLVLLVGWIAMLLACLVLFSWDLGLQLWRFLIGIVLLVVGFSVSQSQALYLLQALVNGTASRSFYVSIMHKISPLSGMIGPPLFGLLFSYGYLDLTVSILFDVLAVSFAVLCIFWPRIVVYEDGQFSTLEDDST